MALQLNGLMVKIFVQMIYIAIDEVVPMSDEIEAIKRGEEQYKKSEVYSHNNVWL